MKGFFRFPIRFDSIRLDASDCDVFPLFFWDVLMRARLCRTSLSIHHSFTFSHTISRGAAPASQAGWSPAIQRRPRVRALVCFLYPIGKRGGGLNNRCHDEENL